MFPFDDDNMVDISKPPIIPALDEIDPLKLPLVAFISPVIKAFEAVSCPSFVTWNLLEDKSNSVGTVLDDILNKDTLDEAEKASSEFTPNVNPPIVPPSAVISLVVILPLTSAVESSTFEAVTCPLAFTLKLLADMISSAAVVEEERTKLSLDSLLAPNVNPPIVPPVASISSVTIVPLIDTFEAVTCPLAFTLKLLADIISAFPVEDDIIKLLLDIKVVPIVNPPMLPSDALSIPLMFASLENNEPLIFAADAVSPPAPSTWNLLVDIIKSVSVVDDDRTKLVLDNLLSPILNPPILPALELIEPLNSPLVAVILPLKSTLEAVILPFNKWKLDELISIEPVPSVTDELMKLPVVVPKNTFGDIILTFEPLKNVFLLFICKSLLFFLIKLSASVAKLNVPSDFKNIPVVEIDVTPLPSLISSLVKYQIHQFLHHQQL